MSNHDETTVFNYPFDAETEDDKRVDLKFYFNFNCERMIRL